MIQINEDYFQNKGSGNKNLSNLKCMSVYMCVCIYINRYG